MADYIDTNIICQAYLHIDPVPKGLDEEALKKTLQEALGDRARFFLYDAVRTDVDTREGSLKVYATILGSIVTFLLQYPDFREGVTLLAQDAKRVSDYAVSECLFLSKSRHQSVLHAEARTGICGSLKRIADEADSIAQASGSEDPSRLIDRIEKLRKDVLLFKDNLNSAEDREYVLPRLKDYVQQQIPNRAMPHKDGVVAAAVAYRYVQARKELLAAIN